jgi:two-component system nitrogen regulation response regulator GlnG
MSQRPPGTPPDPGSPSTREGYILLVDDEESIAEVIVSLYRDDEGYEVLAARSSEQAIALAPPVPPAFILLDINLHEETPAEAVATLRTHAALAQAPLVLFTADALASAMQAELGAVEWLRKPYDIADALALADRLGAVRQRPSRY